MLVAVAFVAVPDDWAAAPDVAVGDTASGAAGDGTDCGSDCSVGIPGCSTTRKRY